MRGCMCVYGRGMDGEREVEDGGRIWVGDGEGMEWEST